MSEAEDIVEPEDTEAAAPEPEETETKDTTEDTEVDAGAETEEPEDESDSEEDEPTGSDDDGEETDSEHEVDEDGYVTVELDGKEYKVHADIADGYRREGEYRRLTQEVAEVKRESDEKVRSAEQRVQFTDQFVREVATLEALNAEIKQFDSVDWQSWLNHEDEKERRRAENAQAQLTYLERERNAQAQELRNKVNERKSQEAEAHRAAIAKRDQEMKKTIKDWDKRWPQLKKTAANDLGFAENEVENVTDPRMIRVLDLAAKQIQTMKAATKVKNDPPPPKPVRKVKRSSPVQKDPDKMSVDEWKRWREQQLRKKQAS